MALVVAIAGIAMPPGETLWHLFAAPEEDGSWHFVSIDGVDVREMGYSAHLRWGEIIGWDDGCNDCGFSDSNNPSRGVICTLQACTELPTDRLFRLWPNSNPEVLLRGDRLILTIPGHRAELVRSVGNGD